jgi:hypothetical protein
VSHLLRASTNGPRVDEAGVAFLVSVITGVQPKDQLEAMLAAQMGTVHVLAMEFARRLNSAESIVQQDSAERCFTKLTRTYVAQLDALKRYRSNGEQRVVVEHLNVGQGGQAVVGNITHGGVGSSQKQQTTP